MQNARRFAAAFALALAAVPASAGTLYKSIGANGVIQFSDLPPSDNSQVVERRPLESIGSVKSAAQSNVMNVSQSLDSDESIVRANAQVDLAEQARALARRALGSELEGLKLTTQRATVSDVERVEFYKRGVIAARQNLLEVLHLRATPNVVVAAR